MGVWLWTRRLTPLPPLRPPPKLEGEEVLGG
jgi:hypothetical protein